MRSRLGTICVASLLVAFVTPAWAASAPHLRKEAEVRAWLRDRLGPPQRDDAGRAARYALGWADLNGDSVPEAIIYISGPGWCGSGGCKMYVLQSTATGFWLRARTTVTRPPIAILDARTHGWRDLGVRVAGGGIVRGYQARLRFDGRQYLSNPSMAPAVIGRPREHIVIRSDDQGLPVLGETSTEPTPPLPTLSPQRGEGF